MSINGRMGKEGVVHNTMKYYFAIKRNKIWLFAETWMDLETVKQNEVSQKEKDQCVIIQHIYMVSEKICIDNLIYKAEIQTDM